MTALAVNHAWSFTTAACSQAPVVLGAAANFVVLAGSTVTNTGPTSVTGDLGVSPGTAVTGFPPGHRHRDAARGRSDRGPGHRRPHHGLQRCRRADAVPGHRGRKPRRADPAPGLYKSTSSLAISSGDLTLDAQGDGDAVFIFQMASTLTTTAGRQVILIDGAKSANVFWQVGSSATLGTTSAFQGTIMADQAITLEHRRDA